MDDEQPLPGGWVNEVVRVAGTVRRPLPPRAAFVRQLLHHLERQGWAGAPRHLGVDSRGREVLSFVDGHAGWERVQPPEVYGEASLVRVAELVREFHDHTAGTGLAAGREVVCHNDLSPQNTVYRDTGAGLRPVAFIDWDRAAPGRRVHDVAHMCATYLALGPTVADPVEAARMVRVMVDAYGLADRSDLVGTVLWCQERTWRGIEAGAAAGEPACLRLRAAGVVEECRDAYDWTAAHRATLERGLV